MISESDQGDMGRSRSGIVVWLSRISAWLFVLLGLAAMLFLSPRTLYADPWRFVKRLLVMPWPANVLAVDNGHREVLPNLVRLAELELVAGGQWLQIIVGTLLALSTFGIMRRMVFADRLAPSVHAAAILVAAMSIFWLGNQRALAHGNESVHVYLVTIFLVSGVALLLRGGDGRTLVAVAFGILASFSFGSGVAVFSGYALILLLRRARLRHWVLLGLSLGLVLATHVFASKDEPMSTLVLSPVTQLDLLLRWLASPFIYAAWPLLDPHVATRVPVLGETLAVFATRYQSIFGPAMVSRWPNMLFGLGGMVFLVRMTWLAWRRGETVGNTEALGLAMGWFGVSVGGLIALARMAYFSEMPEQLAASRYLPWSSLFWAGLALAAIGRPHLHARHRAAWIMLAVACAILPSSAWTGMLAERTLRVAERVATAAAVNVIDLDADMGENVPSEVAAALPALRASRAEMFAWPEMRYLEGWSASDDSRIESIPGIKVAGIVSVNNMLARPAWRVEFRVAGIDADRLILMCEERPVGLAIRARSGAKDGWIGWVDSPVEVACLSVFRLR